MTTNTVGRLFLVVPVLVLWLAMPVAAGAQAQPPLGGRPELARLDTLLAKGDVQAAAALLQTLDPELAKDNRLAFDTIYVLIGRSRFDDARAQWNRLAARLQESLRAASAAMGKPGADEGQRQLAEALFTQALLMARGGDRKEALQLLQQADGLGFPPLESPLMLLAADCLLDLQEYDLAASAYGEYLKQNPSHLIARAGLGAALYSTGKIHEARTQLEDVLRAAPKTPRANYTLGAVLFELKLYEDARAHLERELALDARCTPCLARLAHIAYLEGDDRKCESWLAKATAVDPANIEAQLVAGMLALRGGRYEVAIEHLARVVTQSPEFPTARYQLATAYLRAGQPDKAREHLEAYQRLLREQKNREMGVRGVK